MPNHEDKLYYVIDRCFLNLSQNKARVPANGHIEQKCGVQQQVLLASESLGLWKHSTCSVHIIDIMLCVHRLDQYNSLCANCGNLE